MKMIAKLLTVARIALYHTLFVCSELVKGWLSAEWGISENNRRARFYRLTAEGRKQLDAEAKEFERLVRSIQLVMRTAPTSPTCV